MIPVDKMSEHMRVQLLDPKWREEQKRFLDKQKETGMLSSCIAYMLCKNICLSLLLSFDVVLVCYLLIYLL